MIVQPYQIDNLLAILENINYYANGLQARNQSEMYNLLQIHFEVKNAADVITDIMNQ